MRRDRRAPRMHRVDGRLQVGHGERRRAVPGGRVHVDLDQVRADVQLVQRGVPQIRPVHGHPQIRVALLADPGPGDAHVRRALLATVLVAHADRERDAVGGRRADVTCPEDARLRESSRVVARDLPEHVRRIVAALDPVTSALHGEVAVAIDHCRHDRGAPGIDDLRALRIGGIVRADPCDPAVVDREAHAGATQGARAIGERGVMHHGPGHRRMLGRQTWRSRASAPHRRRP